MSGHSIERNDPDVPIFVIAVAAELAGMHPQTLRGYDRLGLVVPRRAKGRGRGRRYSMRDIFRLRRIQQLSQDEGVNLEGIKRILSLESEMEQMRRQLVQLTRIMNDLQADPHSTRVFTAAAAGEVHIGRHRPPTRRELTR
ncbi:MAG: MerR family transcriptional regulator [Propionibacteriaceae bacterium]|jgi:MerR family transcriptional regulator/heat shock protein HspR|nr:MerR family transcriptional regulator [Propionibacteriaceae bacterium]